MEKITIELPVVKVGIEDPWCGCDYGKEHYERGMFVIDDGISRYFGMWDGLSLWHCPMPHDVFDKFVVERAIRDNDETYHRDMEAIGDRLSQIARLVGETKDEVAKSATRVVDQLDSQRDAEAHEFALVMEGMKGLHDAMPKNVGCEGMNILDVARAAAVIQKPELIKELSK